MKHFQKTVCAVVVTYNREELLMECLEVLENQSRPLDAIYIVDNASNDETPLLLLERGYLEKIPPKKLDYPWEKSFIKNEIAIHYLRMDKNTGGSGGFHEGVKRAYQKGYDWFWLMDDDSEPYTDALELLSKYFDEEKISALANSKFDPEMNFLNYHIGFLNFRKGYPEVLPIHPKKLDVDPYVEVDMSSFVGILVNKIAIDEIGFPKKEFFIYHDDVEYCIRLRKVGRILMVWDSVIIHKDYNIKNRIRRPFFGKTYLRHAFDSYWTEYFNKRNLTWLKLRYKTNEVSIYFNLIISFLTDVLKIILVDDKKNKRISLLFYAYKDGIYGNFDNEKPKRILY